MDITNGRRRARRRRGATSAVHCISRAALTCSHTAGKNGRPQGICPYTRPPVTAPHTTGSDCATMPPWARARDPTVLFSTCTLYYQPCCCARVPRASPRAPHPAPRALPRASHTGVTPHHETPYEFSFTPFPGVTGDGTRAVSMSLPCLISLAR